MVPVIKNADVYVNEMRKSVLDKMFFFDKIFEPIDTIVDFGCANGDWIKTASLIFPEYNYIGYDISKDMIKLAQENIPKYEFYYNWNKIKYTENSLLNLSSVIHEVYSYLTDEQINIFWDKVFKSGFKYIAIREMMPDTSYNVPYIKNDIDKIKSIKSKAKMLKDFENVNGKIKTKKDMLHFLMKCRYIKNWDREVKEDYFPLTREKLIEKIPENYEIVYEDNFILPYLKHIVKQDFDIDINDPTHIKLLLKRIN